MCNRYLITMLFRTTAAVGGCRSFLLPISLATATGAAAAAIGSSSVVKCEAATASASANKNNNNQKDSTLLRKRATLQQAAAAAVATTASAQQQQPIPAKRRATAHALHQIRQHQTEIMNRWQRDEEENWRTLPARAWPKYQPDEKQLVSIRAHAKKLGCFTINNNNNNKTSDKCQELLFHISTSQVFYNLDPPAGLDQYKQLAEQGHVDAMVACGVVLVEGLGGIQPREQEGIAWLQKAVAAGSDQACYELGTVYYIGIDGVVDEDPVQAFQLFQKAAAANNHPAAMFMMADCLIQGDGIEKDVARAVPLLYKAAELGHRYARQHIRELLSRKTYKH